MYEKQLLRELEALRGDVSNAAKKVVPVANGAPKPSVVPPLEDFSDRNYVQPTSSGPSANGFHNAPHRQVPHTAGPADNGGPQGFTPHKLPDQPQIQHVPQSPSSSLFPRTRPGGQEPLSAASIQSFSTRGPLLLSQHNPNHSLPPQSPGAGPSSPVIAPERQSVPRPAESEAPLGGQFVDGTKSMFVTRSTLSPRPSLLSFSSSTSNIPGSNTPFDPLRNDSHARPTSPSPLHSGPSQQALQTQETDPLGSIRPYQMSSSVRVQPTRPRLDAREAASKLANMF